MLQQLRFSFGMAWSSFI